MQSAELLIDKAGGTYSYRWSLKGYKCMNSKTVKIETLILIQFLLNKSVHISNYTNMFDLASIFGFSEI
jgi:hypothetical protein